MQGNTSPDVSVELFDHTSLVQGGLGSALVNCMPCGRTTLRQQLLYPFRLGQGAMKKFSFVHFPAHMDAPSWSTKPFVLTVLDPDENLTSTALPGLAFAVQELFFLT